MLTDSERQAILMAVARSATDPLRAQKAVQATLATVGDHDARNLLQSLVRQKLLTPEGAEELGQRLSSNGDSTPSPGPKTHNGHSVSGDFPARHFGGYRILRKLGQGGTCPVYLGYVEDKDLKVAIKILPEELAGKQNQLDRFYREAKSGSLLNHPNIVRNLTFGQEQASGRHFLVMEYVGGPSALDLLEKRTRLSVGDAVHIILDIARGLEHAHSRNVIHRDIKPDNILLTETGVAKLADMGLAKRTDEASHLTAAHQGFGTPYYMPYEQAVNARHVDGRSDIYALGATLYHLVTGEVPFPGETHMEIVEKKGVGWFPPASTLNPEVPPILDDILDLTLAREPKDRYQTVSELIVSLERANLTSPVLSFVDHELAITDPVVRERLVSAALTTSLDLHLRHGERPAPQQASPDIWYLRFPTRKQEWCKARATTEQVLKRLRDRKIPRDVQASNKIDGIYRPLSSYPVFRRAMRQIKKGQRPSASATMPHPAPVVVPPPTFWQVAMAELANRWVLYLGGSLVAAILVTVGLVLLGFWQGH